MACLDTTILIDLASGNANRRKNAFNKLAELVNRGDDIVTTRFNVAELYTGAARSANPQTELKVINNLVKNISILEFEDKAAWLFGRITSYLQIIGNPIGDMDVLIASTAMVSGHTIVTKNVSHFRNIPDLIVETY
ncbi:MAG: hypothetical protein A2Y12_00680 [Planctomycetes bacterium GWF2_42_9]|nr:MAG: hypothetical protein A2Y12_00680 [Planctomycetes bacterium GWF2_42_9]HAL44720.1 hypothetical protein [Phycisphaerales bacterium]